MTHGHNVEDTYSRFIINPITRAIRNESSKKVSLIQLDHNSARFTFECPRYIEEHDYSLSITLICCVDVIKNMFMNLQEIQKMLMNNCKIGILKKIISIV